METKNKKSELEEFLDYCTERKEITESQSKIILEKIGQQLAGNLAFDVVVGLNEKFEEWRKKRKEIQEKIIPQILPEKYMFLSNEKYLIDYFLDRDLTNLNIEYYKNRMEKNIGILKKYIDDDVIGTFMKEIVEYFPEYLEKLLSVLHEIGVNKSEDLIKLRGLGIITTDNLITLNEIGINKPEDLIKLKGILPILDTEGIKKVLETLKSVGITKVDDLVKLEGIIKSGKYYSGLISRRSIGRIVGTRDDIILNIKNLKELGVETADDFSKFEKTICQGKPETVKENIEVLKECGMKSADDLVEFENVIINGEAGRMKENIETLKGLGIEKIDDLAKFGDTIINGEAERIKANIEILKECGITSNEELAKFQDIIREKINIPIHFGYDFLKKNWNGIIHHNIFTLKNLGITSIDDLAKIQDIIISGSPKGMSENIKLLQTVGIKTIDDFSKLSNLIAIGNTEDIKVLIEIGISSVNDFSKLSDIVTMSGSNEEILRGLEELGITSADDIVELKPIFATISKKKVKENLLVLKNMGIFKVKDLKDLKQIIQNCKTETLLGLNEIGINGVQDLKELEGIITDYLYQGKSVENIKALKEVGIVEIKDYKILEKIIKEGCPENILALKQIGITSLNDFKELEEIILSNNTSIAPHLLVLKECGISSAKDLRELKGIILSYYDAEIIKEKILKLKECGISSVKDLRELNGIILSYYNPKTIKENILELKRIGITSLKDFKELEEIIGYGVTKNIELLNNFGISKTGDLNNFKDLIKNHKNIDELERELNILFNEWYIQKPEELKIFQQAILYGNISTYKEYFGDIKNGVIEDIEMKVLSGIKLPKKIKFKENDHKGYLRFIGDIVDTDYYDEKKSKMIEKIVTLGFNEAEKYLKIFKMLDASISMDVQRVKNELIDEVLESDNPLHVAEQIINIFERNNLPLTGKIFKVFELLYPKDKFNRLLNPVSGEGRKGSPMLNNYKDEGKNVYGLIYKDLMNIAIKSGDLSLKQYLNIFIGSEPLLEKFEGIVRDPGFNQNNEQCLEGISSDEKEQLRYLFKKIEMLSIMFLGKELKKWDKNYVSDKNDASDKNDVSDKNLIDFYNGIKEGFNLRNGKSIYKRLKTLLYVNGLGYHSASEVLEDMNQHKRQAHERGLKLYNEANGNKLDFPKHAFLKGIDEDVFPKIIDRGVTSREYLGGGDDGKDSWNRGGTGAGSDATPFDIDGLYVNSPKDWTRYGLVNLIINTDRCDIVDTGDKGLDGYKENKYELFVTGGGDHYGIRTGIPTTEIDYIIYNGSFKEIEEPTTINSNDDSEGENIIKLSKFQSMCYEIARNGYYIPITDKEGNIKFTPEMYHKIRLGFNYMDYYDGFDVELKDGKWVSKEIDNTVTKEYKGENRKINDGELRDLVVNNSPSNEKYAKFAKENRELADNTIEWIKKILEDRCGIKFNSKYDSSITGAEIHDSGSTGRGTDIPTRDVDLDFTLILDAKDYEKVDEISKIIHEEIGTKEDDDRDIQEGGNQIKSKKNNIGKSDDRPDGVPLDLLILKKSQVINYSSSDAMKEKLNYIANNSETGTEDLDWVRTNVIIMKKLLKAKECYKKPEGGISGIGVENWLTQHHGSFIEALESFEQVAYGGEYKPGKEPIPLEDFQKLYPMYDAGENYKDGGNDNFVYKLKERGYQGTLQIIKVLRNDGVEGIKKIISEYEKKKSKFIE